ncbi:hypothetical protein TTRE_0000402301 [Trichuris trichiura]|uniref:DUF1758 domain containing protein n=1 Tax=Trichuris trichiura TaxID=36087 RepID=A0A077ZAP7_TRITR|nr:hypothetical protein TTRE_0000402301 [Trichuris trichiura]
MNGSNIVLLSVVPVMTASGDRVVPTYAQLDTGNEGPLITERLVRQKHLTEDRCQLRLSNFHGQDPPEELLKTRFQIRSVRGEKTLDMKNAIVVPLLNATNRTIDRSKINGRFRHLNNLPLVKIDYAQKYGDLQGKDGKYSFKTPLGWTVCGRFLLSEEEHILHPIHINRDIVKAAESEPPLIETLEVLVDRELWH